MSRIYFHTLAETGEVKGSERAYMSLLAADFALAVIKPDFLNREWLMSVTNGPDYLFSDEHWVDRWKTSVRIGDAELLVDGEAIGCSELALNTLLATGSPVLALIARLDGSCEDHAWCAPENAHWLAEVIRQGRSENVLRPRQGWEDVADLYERAAERGDHVVCSYSVTDGFPNRYVAGEPWFYPWEKGPDGEYLPNEPDDAAAARWDDLPERERWDLALDAIKTREHTRELRPNDDHGFQSGASAFDLVAEQWLTRCPYCSFTLPAGLDQRDRGRAEVDHMNEAHPEVIEQRMIAAGFVREDVNWFDTLLDPRA